MNGEDDGSPPPMVGLNAELLERLYKITAPGDFDESLRRIFFKEHPQQQRPQPEEQDDFDRITAEDNRGASFAIGNTSCSSGRHTGVDAEREEDVHSGNVVVLN